MKKNDLSMLTNMINTEKYRDEFGVNCIVDDKGRVFEYDSIEVVQEKIDKIICSYDEGKRMITI